MKKSKRKSPAKRAITFVSLDANAKDKFVEYQTKFPSANFLVLDAEEDFLSIRQNGLEEHVLAHAIFVSGKPFPDVASIRKLYAKRAQCSEGEVLTLEGSHQAYLVSGNHAIETLIGLQGSPVAQDEWFAVLKALAFHSRKIVEDPQGPATLNWSSLQRSLQSILPRWKSALMWPFTRLGDLKSFGDAPFFGRFCFSIVSVLMLISMLAMSGSAGISGDEFRYRRQSEKVFKYFRTGGEDKSAVTRSGIDPQHYNAQSFDVVMSWLEKVVKPKDAFKMRHRFNALVGWIGIFFAGLLMGRMFGWQFGILAMLLLFCSPRYLGHCFNNHRDIPVATAYMVALYFFTRYFKEFRSVQWTTLLGMVMAIAFAFSIRLASGVLLIGVLGVLTAIHLVRSQLSKGLYGPVQGIIWHLKYLVPAAIASFALGILLWPFGLEAPIKNSLEVFNASSNLGVSLRQIFDGEVIMSNQIPLHYLPKYILISTPLLILIGLLLAPLFVIKSKRKEPFVIFLIAFAFLFPLIYSVLQVKNDYGGWRHFLFIYPPMALLATLGLGMLGRLLPGKFRWAFFPLLLIGLFHPIRYTIANHPYQYTYYNEAIGGINGAHGAFETDYSLMSLQEGIRWIKANVTVPPGEKLTIASNDGTQLRWGLRQDTAQFNAIYKRYYEKYDQAWDYGVFANVYVHPDQLRNGQWPPANTIHTIKADDVVLCAIVKREDHRDVEAYAAAKSRDHVTAIREFEAFLTDNPTNDQAWAGLAASYFAQQNYPKAIETADKGLALFPANVAALNYKGLALLNAKNYPEAESTFRALYKVQSNNYAAAYYLAMSLFNQQKAQEAKQYIDASLALNGKFGQAFDLAAKIYRSLGLSAQADRLLQLKSQIK
ncbi:MAG: tetratricopeptide repeat protein [Saprospiraceae bacterium]|nr:tetratricopeptide repeat protein [Saprospiraceae bacterium]